MRVVRFPLKLKQGEVLDGVPFMSSKYTLRLTALQDVEFIDPEDMSEYCFSDDHPAIELEVITKPN